MRRTCSSSWNRRSCTLSSNRARGRTLSWTPVRDRPSEGLYQLGRMLPIQESACGLYQVGREIAALVPPGGTFILVDDGQLVWPAWRTQAFPERDGVYWGPPADDAIAISELERMTGEGAACIAIGWPPSGGLTITTNSLGTFGKLSPACMTASTSSCSTCKGAVETHFMTGASMHEAGQALTTLSDSLPQRAQGGER